MFGARGGVAGRYSCSPDQGRTVATINVHVLRGDIVQCIYIIMSQSPSHYTLSMLTSGRIRITAAVIIV